MFWDYLELSAQLQAFSTFQHDEKLMALPQFVRSDGPYPGPFTFPGRSPALRNLSSEGLGPSGHHDLCRRASSHSLLPDSYLISP